MRFTFNIPFISNKSKVAAVSGEHQNSGLNTRANQKTKGFFNQSFGEFGGEKYENGISGSGESYSIDGKKMALNARRAAHDSLEARALIDRNCDVVVDVGIQVSPDCNASLLGISLEDAEKWNNDVKSRFHLYMSSRTCHRQRMMNGYEAQRLFNRTFLVDNDQYVRFFFEKEDDALSTVSFQLVDPMNIVGNPKVNTNGDIEPHDGISRDKKGREIAYNISGIGYDGDFVEITVPAKQNDRIFMVHGFLHDQISQLSGYSQFGHIIQEFQNLTDFKLSHIDKAIAQASQSLAIENTGDNDPSNPFDGDVTGAAVDLGGLKFSSLSGEEQDAVSEVSYDTIKNFNSGPRGSLGILNLRAKDKVHMLGNTAPVTNYDAFVNSFISHMAASARMPVEVLLMKFGSNYSASRGALILFYRVAEIYRKKIDSDFLTPLYDNWLSEEIAAGRVRCNGWSDPVLKAAWLTHNLEAPQVPNIDPLKTSVANKNNISIGATTYDRAAQETNGSSGSANRAANKNQASEVTIPYWEKDNRAVEEPVESDIDIDKLMKEDEDE